MSENPGEQPWGKGISTDDENAQLVAMQRYAEEQPDNNRRDAAFFSKVFAAGLVGFTLTAAALYLVDAYEEGSSTEMAAPLDDMSEDLDADEPTTSTTIEPFQPVTPVTPEFHIDFKERAIANAAMVDIQLEHTQADGSLSVDNFGGGGLLEHENGALYVATARRVFEPFLSADEDFVVRAIIPIGDGYDPLEFVLPVGSFKEHDANPHVVQAPVHLIPNTEDLSDAISDRRIIPLQMTSLFRHTGKTVVGSASLEGAPVETDTGKVQTRTIRQYIQQSGEVGFMSDETDCVDGPQIGDFVLVPTKGNRVDLRAYAIVTWVDGPQVDPHAPEAACLTAGSMAINNAIESTTF